MQGGRVGAQGLSLPEAVPRHNHNPAMLRCRRQTLTTCFPATHTMCNTRE